MDGIAFGGKTGVKTGTESCSTFRPAPSFCVICGCDMGMEVAVGWGLSMDSGTGVAVAGSNSVLPGCCWATLGAADGWGATVWTVMHANIKANRSGMNARINLGFMMPPLASYVSPGGCGGSRINSNYSRCV